MVFSREKTKKKKDRGTFQDNAEIGALECLSGELRQQCNIAERLFECDRTPGLPIRVEAWRDPFKYAIKYLNMHLRKMEEILKY